MNCTVFRSRLLQCAVPKSFLLFHLISVQYALQLYHFVQEWRKNPHWSFSCCLGLLLPLNDFQGEIRGLAGANVFKTQLQTGEFEVMTFQAAVKDTGAIDVTLGKGQEDDQMAKRMNDDDLEMATNVNKKCHIGTQTEFLSLILSHIS